MKQRFFTMLVIFSTNLTFFAQDLPKILPPSPEAASLGKFNEVPVSLYTGLPNISIPLASCSVGDKAFPISLSYHARGIKVEEIASRVGIGWALNAGGQISRQTRGVPDDNNGSYLNRPNILMDGLANEIYENSFFGNQALRISYVSSDILNDPPQDRNPDQFNVQAGTLAAKFIFDYRGDQPLIQSYEDIKIEYEMGNTSVPQGSNIILSFLVTDKDGYKYYFGVSKDGFRNARNWDENMASYTFTSSSYSDTSSPFELNFNAWQLMDVESPQGELVSFIYQEETSEFFRRSYDDPSEMINYSSKIQSHQFQLSEIRFNFDQTGNYYNKIIFESNLNRQDLNGGKELNNVKVFDRHQNLVKAFILHHSYPLTVNDNNQNYQLKLLEPQSSKRLFLDSIVEVGKQNFQKPPYIFYYNSQSLPNRFTNSQDLWGYYNGKNNGQFLRFFGELNEVDRGVDPQKAMAGLLEQVRYPTGGSTKFIYEHNIGHLGNEYQNIVLPNVNPVETKNNGISFFDHNLYINNQYEKNIVVSNIVGPMRFNVNLPDMNGVNQNIACGNPIQSACFFDIKLEGLNGSPSYHYIFSGQQNLSVVAGEYKLILKPNNPYIWDHTPPNTPIFNISLAWEEELLSGNYIYSAGKRIKGTEFYDSNGNLISQKTYAYINPDNGNESGVILNIPSFGTLNPHPTLGGFGVWQPGAAIPGGPFTTYQGNSIGHEYVTEYHGTELNNVGKSVYKYSVTKDSGDYLNYPVTPPTNNEWLRGLALDIKHYRTNPDKSYSLVKQTSNEYYYAGEYELPLVFTPLSHNQSIDDNWQQLNLDLSEPGLLYKRTNSFYRLPLINLFYPLNTITGEPNINEQHYKIYHITGGVVNNLKTTNTLYDTNQNPTLITISETEFDYAKHYQPVTINSVTSDGEAIIQQFTFPHDLLSGNYINSNYSTPETIDDELHFHNRVLPLEVKSFTDLNNNGIAEGNEQTSMTKTVFNWFGSNLEPSLIQTGKGPNPILIDRLDFKEYDDYGNLLQVSKVNGTDITYIYGYDYTLPIAKLENATYTEIQSYVTNLQTLSNADNDRTLGYTGNEGNFRQALDNLRNNLPNALVTTYTHDPLVGITSITDPRGYTTYYEYDDFNRLMYVKDQEGNILSENQYNYANQN